MAGQERAIAECKINAKCDGLPRENASKTKDLLLPPSSLSINKGANVKGDQSRCLEETSSKPLVFTHQSNCGETRKRYDGQGEVDSYTAADAEDGKLPVCLRGIISRSRVAAMVAWLFKFGPTSRSLGTNARDGKKGKK